MNTARKDKSFNKAEKSELIRMMEDYHSGDESRVSDAKVKMIANTENFIESFIKKHYPTYSSDSEYYQDMVSESKLAVLENMGNYDPEKGAVTTFFYRYIIAACQRVITPDIMNNYQAANSRKIRAAGDDMEKKGVPYSEEELAKRTGMSLRVIKSTIRCMRSAKAVHMDQFSENDEDDGGSARLDSLCAGSDSLHAVSPEDILVQRTEIQDLYLSLSHLPEQTKNMVMDYYAAGGKGEGSYGKIAGKYGCSTESARETIKRAILKLGNDPALSGYRNHKGSDWIRLTPPDPAAPDQAA